MCLALDHEATEKHSQKSENGCLSCNCQYQEFASWTRCAGATRLVEDVIRIIEEGAAEHLNSDGTIKNGHILQVGQWEAANRIKLHWNDWFDVRARSFPL